MIEQDSRSFDISVQYVEIYNETINDLIDPANKNLEVRESIKDGIYINRLSDNKVSSVQEVLSFMEKGDEVRNIASTKLNELSSRSHTVFRINIKSWDEAEEPKKFKVSQLNLVDLAGSEGASKTQAEGLRLREGQNINRSLLALSNVINRLSQSNGARQFINYRDSKLTRILQPALGGNSQTAIICTMTQTISNYQETVNTLQFGQKAKNVKTTVNVNEVEASKAANQETQAALNELAKAKKTIRELQERNNFLESKSKKSQKQTGSA